MEGPDRHKLLNELVKQIRSDIGVYRDRNYNELRAKKMLGLETLLGVTVEQEIGSGDSSIIYRARSHERLGSGTQVLPDELTSCDE